MTNEQYIEARLIISRVVGESIVSDMSDDKIYAIAGFAGWPKHVRDDLVQAFADSSIFKKL